MNHSVSCLTKHKNCDNLYYYPPIISVLQRPRRCHVFVNPFSGEGLACKVYNTKIAHIFQIAGITTTVTGMIVWR